ncbi:pectate lyase, partial [Pyricularia oryzae Y34]
MSRNTEGAKPPPFSDVGNHPPFATALAGILGPQPESLYWDNDRGVLADPNCSTAGKYLQQDSVEPPPLVTMWRAGLVNVSNVRSSPLQYCTAVNYMPPSWHWLQSQVRSAILYGPDLSAPFAKFFQNGFTLTVLSLRHPLATAAHQVICFARVFQCSAPDNLCHSFRLFAPTTVNMKFNALALLVGLVAASPLETREELIKRQANQACNIGYCTQNGGTRGGAGGSTVTVKTLSALTEAAGRSGPLTIIVSGNIQGSAKVRVTADKTIYGERGSSLTGIGLYIRQAKNVIVRNMKISGVKASNGDAIGIDASTNVWVDHCDLKGDLNAGKDDLDGLLDISHGADFITVSHVYFHDA